MEDAVVLGVEFPGLVATEVAAVGAHGRGRVVERIADGLQRQPRVEAGGRLAVGRVGPQSVAGVRQLRNLGMALFDRSGPVKDWVARRAMD